MKTNPILSFCIPTFNRPGQLKRLLEQLKPQLTQEIEVLIRDDSTNNESRKVVKKILPSARYVHGKKIGLDLANMWLLEHAKGEWMWYFSDDDELVEGAVNRVLRVLKRDSDIGYAFANFISNGKIATKGGGRYFRDKNEPLEMLGTDIGLLSTFIIRRKLGLPFLQLGKDHSIGFAFASLIPVMGALSVSKKSYLFAPCVRNNPTTLEEIKEITVKNGVIQNPNFDIFGVNFYETIHLFDGAFERSSIRKMIAVSFAALWRGMLVGWVGGWDTPDGKRWRMLKMYWSYPECWVALVAFMLPLPLNRRLFRIYKMFFNERKWIKKARARELCRVHLFRSSSFENCPKCGWSGTFTEKK